jgi:hypothetical protein
MHHTGQHYGLYPQNGSNWSSVSVSTSSTTSTHSVTASAAWSGVGVGVGQGGQQHQHQQQPQPQQPPAINAPSTSLLLRPNSPAPTGIVALSPSHDAPLLKSVCGCCSDFPLRSLFSPFVSLSDPLLLYHILYTPCARF